MSNGHDSASESIAETSGPAPGPTAADPLSQVLETIRLKGAVFFLWEPAWPYANTVPHGNRFSPLILPGSELMISYHIVCEGPCWGSVAGEAPVRLDSGDILLLPHGDGYCIASEPRAPDFANEAQELEFFKSMAAGQLPTVIPDGGPGPQKNRVICGFLGCDMRPFNPLLSTLPRMLRVPAPKTADPLAALIDLALAESTQARDGSRCMLLRLSEVMFVEVIRRYLHNAEIDSSWLSGLRDPLVGAALNQLHQRVSQPWTLESLARAVGSSRSTLAERFTALVGEPPMQYLTRWRMQLAARRLADGAEKNFAVAHEVGYESEAAFSRAFKRVVGVTPSQWRKSREI